METKIIEKLILAKANIEYEKIQLEVRLEEMQEELEHIKTIINSDDDLKTLFKSVQEKRGD